jgi:hypothetical protein
MTNEDPRKGLTPRDTAESEEQELTERSASERGAKESTARRDDDPREEDGWTQPESSAQKGAARDEG